MRCGITSRRGRSAAGSAFLAVLALTAAPASVSAQPQGPQIQTGLDCTTDVVLIGARASGQPFEAATRGLGEDLNIGFEVLRERLAESGSTVSATAVDYPAEPVLVGVVDPARYERSLALGRDKVLELLAEHARQPACAHQKIVLAGYSQGAMSVHRALRVLSGDEWHDARERISGVVLVADGDRVPHDETRMYGTADSGTHGVAVEFGGASTERLRRDVWGNRVLSVCLVYDAVCGLRQPLDFAVLAEGGTVIHTQYQVEPVLREVFLDVPVQ